MDGELKVFGGRAHPSLVEEICEYLQIPSGKMTKYTFSDGEIFCQIDENVRGSDIFVVQPTCHPVNENLMELLIMLDAFKRSSASRVTAVIPYYGYARQDKKDQPRVPITAKLVADLISAAGADRILTMDLHASQIQGFFDVPVDHLFAAPVLLDAIRSLEIPELVIVSPDAGGVERTGPNEAEVMHVIGEVTGRNVLIIDDIIDTAGTLTKAIAALRKEGAERILAAGVHGVLSGPALDRILNSPLEQVLITNTTPIDSKVERCSKLKTLSVAPLLGEAIMRIHENSSVSSLFV